CRRHGALEYLASSDLVPARGIVRHRPSSFFQWDPALASMSRRAPGEVLRGLRMSDSIAALCGRWAIECRFGGHLCQYRPRRLLLHNRKYRRFSGRAASGRAGHGAPSVRISILRGAVSILGLAWL